MGTGSYGKALKVRVNQFETCYIKNADPKNDVHMQIFQHYPNRIRPDMREAFAAEMQRRVDASAPGRDIE